MNPDECEDQDENCDNWAKAGECDKNPQFMKASVWWMATQAAAAAATTAVEGGRCDRQLSCALLLLPPLPAAACRLRGGAGGCRTLASLLCLISASLLAPTYTPAQGSPTSLGTCRRACGECTVCAEDDAACRRENRLRAGFLPIHDPDFF